jgi:hypothetical protein
VAGGRRIPQRAGHPFAGYATFRRTKPLVDQKARQIAVQLLARYKAMGLI